MATDTTTDTTELDTRVAEITALRARLEELKKGIKAPFVQALQQRIRAVPGLAKVEWRAYTPYFNDGDACTFGSYHDSANYYFEGEDDPRYEDGACLRWAGDAAKADPAYAACCQVQDLLNSLDTDDYLAMFGDHVRVTVTRDGVETETYDHD